MQEASAEMVRQEQISMQQVALSHRRAVVSRLESVGKLCDELLVQAAALLETLGDDDEGPDADNGSTARPTPISAARCSPGSLPEDRLLKLAKVIQSATVSATTCWTLYRSATGIEMQETAQLAGMIAAAKARAGPREAESPYDCEVFFENQEIEEEEQGAA